MGGLPVLVGWGGPSNAVWEGSPVSGRRLLMGVRISPGSAQGVFNPRLDWPQWS